MMTPQQLEDALDAVLEILDVLEGEATYVNLAPRGEPQLGRARPYRAVGGGDPG